MSTSVGDYIRSQCSTVGIGDIKLTVADGDDVCRFGDVFTAATEVFYSILDGVNRESGRGQFNGVSTIIRSEVHSTLVNGVYDDDNPDPIFLNGSAIVFCGITAEGFTEVGPAIEELQNQQAANNIIISQNEANISVNASNIADNTTAIAGNNYDILTNINNIALLQTDVSLRETAITSMESGGGLSGNGPTNIMVAAGQGEIIDSYTMPDDPQFKQVTWVETNFDLLANAGMPVVIGLGLTEIGIARDLAGDGVGTVKAFPNGMSSAQRRDNIRLGLVEYLDQAITGVITAPIVSNQVGNVVMDMIAFAPVSAKIKGLLARPTTIGDLSWWRDSGQLFGVGANYENSIIDQNVIEISASGSANVAVEFTPLTYNNGATGTGSPVTTINSTVYEPDGAGSVDTIGGGNATIHYLLQSLGGNFYLSYGQREYDNYEEATQALFSDLSHHLFPAETSRMILLAQVTVLKNATTWGLTAEIYPLGSATSSGSEGGSSSQAINISYSDTYALGTNVQAALDSLAAIKLTPDQNDALDAANAPALGNAFATLDDLTASVGVQLVVGGTDISVDNTDPLHPIVSSEIDTSSFATVVYVDSGLALKADIADVSDALVLKADITYVDDSLDFKADITYVDTQDALKQNIVESAWPQAADAAPAATHAFDYAAGDMQQVTVSEDITLSFTGFPVGAVAQYIIELVNGGAFTVTWPAGVLFSGGLAPVLTAAGKDILVIVKDKDEVYSVSVVQTDAKVA